MHFTQHLLVLALSAALAATAAPLPSPAAVPLAASRVVRAGRAGATPAPIVPPTSDASPDALFNWYLPVQEAARQAESYIKQAIPAYSEKEDASSYDLSALLRLQRRAPTPSENIDQAPVPLSQLPAPTFPASIPSCEKCEANYGSLSSCMQASSVFENFTSIFNSPLAYISVIKVSYGEGSCVHAVRRD